MKKIPQRFAFVFVALFALGFEICFAASPTCMKCQELKTAIDLGIQTEKKIQKELADRKEVAKKLSQEDVSKKTRLTSELFVLTAKIETIRNRRIIQRRDLQKLKCEACVQ